MRQVQLPRQEERAPRLVLGTGQVSLRLGGERQPRGPDGKDHQRRRREHQVEERAHRTFRRYFSCLTHMAEASRAAPSSWSQPRMCKVP